MRLATAREFQESAHEYCRIYQYGLQYAVALTEACVALQRWPRDLDDEVWQQPSTTLPARLAYLRSLIQIVRK